MIEDGPVILRLISHGDSVLDLLCFGTLQYEPGFLDRVL